MNTPEKMLEAKIEFANHRLAHVNDRQLEDMPTPMGHTTSPVTLRAGREVYQEEQSLITRMVMDTVNNSATKDAESITKAANRLIAKMGKSMQAEEEFELQA